MSTFADFTVPFDVLRSPPPRIRGGPDGASGEMTFLVALDDLDAFLETVAGETETVILEGGSTIERVVPLVHPDRPALLAMGYEAEAIGTPGGTGTSYHIGQFSHYRVRVDFASLPLGVGGDVAYYTLTTDTAEAFETIPWGAFRFPDSSFVTGNLGLPMPTTVIVLTTFLNVQPVAFALADMVGKVNSAIFDDFPIGTLRFTGVRSDYQQTSLSRSLVKSYMLKFRSRPWNEVMKANGTWDTPTFQGSGITKFQTADLNALKAM